MKIERLRKTLITKAVISGFFLLLVMVALIYLLSLRTDETTKLSRLRIEIGTLYSRLNEMTKKSKEIVEAAKLWQKLNIKDKKREGLKIDAANHLLQEKKKLFHISSLGIDLSTPVELLDKYRTDTVLVVSSDVTLRIKAMTDGQILSFWESLTEELPGYIRLKSFVIKRDVELTQDIIARISKGEVPELVSGEVVFQWRDLKDLPAKKGEASK